jgi:glyoxylase-like metal-dependent hydrolase (beta-lactamase superfamily II)
MIFRQLFEPISCTYTYLLACEETGQALLIDPVMPTLERDLSVINTLGLKLAYTLDTHIHADHITSALHLKEETGSKIANAAMDKLPCTDIGIEHRKPFMMNSVSIMPLHTPGHTDGHFAYLCGGRVFTGDALLIDGCGRTDFQNGDATALYQSIHQQLFTLPDEQLVYPAHDYNQRHVSTVAQERSRNPRLGDGRSLEDFIALMGELKLPYPKFIDYAVPGNRQCGVCPGYLPEQLKEYCENMAFSPQG